MEEILCTKSNSASIKTFFNEETEEFNTCLIDKDKNIKVLQTFKCIKFLVEIHDFWCKFTGVTKSNISIKDIINHVNSA